MRTQLLVAVSGLLLILLAALAGAPPTPVAAQAPTLTVGQLATGTIAGTTPITYQFGLGSTTTVAFGVISQTYTGTIQVRLQQAPPSTSSSSVVPVLASVSGQGSAHGRASASLVAGDYQLVVSATNGNATGSYQVFVVNAAPLGLTEGQTRTATLTAGGVRVFGFTPGSAGTSVTFSLSTSPAVGLGRVVLSPAWAPLSPTSTSPNQFAIPSADRLSQHAVILLNPSGQATTATLSYTRP